jgi:hypothetical protein
LAVVWRITHYQFQRPFSFADRVDIFGCGAMSVLYGVTDESTREVIEQVLSRLSEKVTRSVTRWCLFVSVRPGRNSQNAADSRPGRTPG